MAGGVSGHLLDTSVLIAHDLDAAADLPASAAISVMSLGELQAGVLLARSDAVRRLRRRRLEAVRAAFAALVVDDAVADRYGAVLAAARAERRVGKATDLLIIATAAVHARTLFTLDVAQERLASSVGVAVGNG